MSSPHVEHVRTLRKVGGLQLGFHGAHVDFDHRPYDQRTPEGRAAYDRLADSIRREGVRSPIIVHGPHVLAGMRRVEILRGLGCAGDVRLEALDVTEDVACWTSADVDRFMAWKAGLYPDLAAWAP